MIVDGLELVGLRARVDGSRMTAARASVSARLTRGVGLLGERRLERRQRVGVARLEHGLRRLEPLRRIGRQQRQAAERRLRSMRAQPVVEADRGEIGRRAAGRGCPGRGIDQPVGLVLDENRLRFGAEEQTAVLQCLDDGRGARIAARGDAVDGLDRLARIVGGEACQRVLVGPGLRTRHQDGQHPSAKTSAIRRSRKATHRVSPRHRRRGGPILAEFGPPPFLLHSRR